ncbi:MAG: pantoate kinase [Fervidicoccaceae archaeon]
MAKETKVCAEFSHHISAFWLPSYRRKTLETGSVGAGFLISPVAKSCYPSESFPFKSKPKQITAIERILGLRESIPFSYKDPLPHSVGYSVSATLSLSYSFASLMHISGKPTIGEICRLAHIADVKSGTGLGDVSAICGGRGVVLRLTPGAPGYSVVDSIVTDLEKYTVITSVISKMSTSVMLRRLADSLESEGTRAYEEFLSDPSIEKLVELGRSFSMRVGMMSEELDRELSSILKKQDPLGYFVKKGLVVVVADKGETDSIYENMKAKFGNARKHRIMEEGLRIRFNQ